MCPEDDWHLFEPPVTFEGMGTCVGLAWVESERVALTCLRDASVKPTPGNGGWLTHFLPGYTPFCRHGGCGFVRWRIQPDASLIAV